MFDREICLSKLQAENITLFFFSCCGIFFLSTCGHLLLMNLQILNQAVFSHNPKDLSDAICLRRNMYICAKYYE